MLDERVMDIVTWKQELVAEIRNMEQESELLDVRVLN